MNNCFCWSIFFSILLGGVKHSYGSKYSTMPMLQPEFTGIWGEWGEMENCKNYGHAVGYSIMVESNQGRGSDDTAMNSIRLKCSGGEWIYSKRGYWGSWYTSDTTCSGGFNQFKFQLETKQGGGDDTAANNIQLRCKDTGKWASTDAGKSKTGWGGWWGANPNGPQDDPRLVCPDGQVICGLQTRVEKMGGDDTALNGVRFDCCVPGLTPQTANPVNKQGSTCPRGYPGRNNHCCTKYTVGGNEAYRNFVSKHCVFPFAYKGKMYTSCTSLDSKSYDQRPWCSTKNNEDNTIKEWGYCDCYNAKYDNDPRGWKSCWGVECDIFKEKEKRSMENAKTSSIVFG